MTAERTSVIRLAEPGDIPAVVALVYELAEYEKALEQCRLTVAQMHAALFGPNPPARAHVAVVGREVAGCAVWFRTFSTWEGVPGIHLEDLYVRPQHRGAGLGAGMLAALAARCRAEGHARLEWNVLDWNAPAIGFYQAIGAQPNEGWTTYRLTGDALDRLAAQEAGGSSG